MFKNNETILKRSKLYIRNLLCYLAIIVAIMIATLFVGAFQNGESAAAQQEADTIIPDNKIQALIDNIASPTNQDKKMFSENGRKFLGNKLTELEKLVDGNHEKLIPQLLYYSMSAKDMKHAMAAGFVIEQLGISKRSITLGLMRYLDTNDEVLQKEMYNWLGGVDFDESTKTSNFSLYETIIYENKLAPPKGLIKYMYHKSPETALSTLFDVYTNKPDEKKYIVEYEQTISSDINKRMYGSLENRDKVGDEAKKALSDLSKNEQWWVRLYVAEIVGREPALRSSEILGRLKKDTNPLVHETLKRFQIEQEK